MQQLDRQLVDCRVILTNLNSSFSYVFNVMVECIAITTTTVNVWFLKGCASGRCSNAQSILVMW